MLASLLAIAACDSSSPTGANEQVRGLRFVGNPSDGSADEGLRGVAVEFVDSIGNRVANATGAISVSVNSGPSGAEPVSQIANASNGVATFDNLRPQKSGRYTLAAVSGALARVVSEEFEVTPGAAARLLVLQQPPAAATAGAVLSPVISVGVADQHNNRVSSPSVHVALSLGSSPAAGILAGTVAKQTIDGVATFEDLVLDKTGSYTLAASSNGLSSAVTRELSVGPALATKLVFLQQSASSATVAGSVLSPAIEIAISDQYNNVVTSASPNVTMTLSSSPLNGSLSGTTSKQAVDGIVTFDNLVLHKSGSYTLAASSASLEPATSQGFDVLAGSATKLIFSGQPPSRAPVGLPLSPAIQVGVVDQHDNVVPTANNTITLALSSSPPGATLVGNVVVAAIQGLATFENLSTQTTGEGFQLRATSGSLASATSESFTVTSGSAANLAFNVQPSNVEIGTAFPSVVSVKVTDGSGNLVTSASMPISLALSGGSSDATMSGTRVQVPIGGIASFPDLAINTVGSGYRLSASAVGISTIASNAFDVKEKVLVAGLRASSDLVVLGSSLFVADGDSLMTIPVSGGTLTTVARASSPIVKLAVDRESVYWIEAGHSDAAGAVNKYVLSTGILTRLAAGLTVSSSNVGSTFASDGENVYFVARNASGTATALRSIPVNASNGVPTDLHSSCSSNHSIYFTVRNGLLFFYDTCAGTIRRMTTSGRDVTILSATQAGNCAVRFLAVHLTSLYYFECEKTLYKIAGGTSANPLPAAREAVLTESVYHFAIDPERQRTYSDESGRIVSRPLALLSSSSLLSGNGRGGYQSFAFDANFLYFHTGGREVARIPR